MSTSSRPSQLPEPESKADNTVGWIVANAALWTVAAPFAVAYWASKGVKGIKQDLHAMQPKSGPFRDFRRLAYERDREAKLGVPASNEVYLPMRLDNDRQRPSQELLRPSMSLPARLENRSANPADFRRTEAPRGASEVVVPRFSDARMNLKVAFEDREEAKGFGARFDGNSDPKTWYAPPGTDLKKLAKWLPVGVVLMEAVEQSRAPSAASSAPSVVPADIAKARAASQQQMRLDDLVLVGAMSAEEGEISSVGNDEELPPVDAYDDLSPS